MNHLLARLLGQPQPPARPADLPADLWEAARPRADADYRGPSSQEPEVARILHESYARMVVTYRDDRDLADAERRIADAQAEMDEVADELTRLDQHREQHPVVGSDVDVTDIARERQRVQLEKRLRMAGTRLAAAERAQGEAERAIVNQLTRIAGETRTACNRYLDVLNRFRVDMSRRPLEPLEQQIEEDLINEAVHQPQIVDNEEDAA